MRRVSRVIANLALLGGFVGATLFSAEEKGKKASQQKPAATPAAVVETKSTRTQPLGGEGRWKKVPKYLEGAQIHHLPLDRARNGKDFECTIKTGGVVVVAAS